MKSYLKLLNFEFNRFWKVFAVLLGITFVAQIAAVIIKSKSYLSRANERIYGAVDPMSKAEFLTTVGPMSFADVVGGPLFFGPIALCIAAIAFYIFFIWYRDWMGKNTFIYRLLMLPTTRLNVFFAKITTVLVSALGFVAFQLIILPIEATILKWMVPKGFRVDMGVQEIVNSMHELLIIIPNTFIQFILYYGTGFMAVAILFTAILFERSFRWKGIIIGAIYSAVAVVIFLSPILVQELLRFYYLYPVELLIFECVMGLIVIACSIWVSGFLLKKKITV
ncbi:hypothetical protein [Virgibacillus necropolis]|uniref:Uncharacterized protein n=1 Tax=Virgibacillus necropolis TaxID=163877 RepID=A0A221MHX4_9BACI|nr:hypothetical protein [Virgibacillus necropolis]ASN07235.1 hypothetical protein CFK40_20630 [Virgibacillus necropolis]